MAITETIEIDIGPAAHQLDAFASLLERHAAALTEQAASFRAELAELMAAVAQDDRGGGEGTGT